MPTPDYHCNERGCPAGLEQFECSPIACCPVSGSSVIVNSSCEVELYSIQRYLREHTQAPAQTSPSCTDSRDNPTDLSLIGAGIAGAELPPFQNTLATDRIVRESLDRLAKRL